MTSTLLSFASFLLRRRRSTVLVFLQLPQDFDLVLPTLLSLKNQKISCYVLLTSQLLHSSPRISAQLKQQGVSFFALPKRLIGRLSSPPLRSVLSVLCATESTAGPHRIAHRLTEYANRMNIPTFTLQHGFDNIGLTYFDEEYPPDKVRFASSHIFLWGDLSTLDGRVRPDTRERCIPIGLTKKAVSAPIPEDLKRGRKTLVGVFENLHWSRFSDYFRAQFLADISALADNHPEITFLLKPHHSGRWINRNLTNEWKRPENLIVADPRSPEWEPYTAPAILGVADAVITTPSTVALDSALLCLPIALTRYDLDLPRYEPLLQIRNYGELNQFINDLKVPERRDHLILRSVKFKELFVVDTEGASKVAAILASPLVRKP